MCWLSRFWFALLLLSTSTAAGPVVSTNETTLAEKVELLFAPGRDLADVTLTVDALANPATDVAAGQADTITE